MSDAKNILVVGGAGFIGSHVVLALEDAGYGVIIYDNFSSGHEDVCAGKTVVRGELADRELLANVMVSHNIHGVIHFAALIEAGVSVVEPLSFFRNNVAATLSLLEAMEDANVTRLVFSSTAAVYGQTGNATNIPETQLVAPINPYGDSKAMVETMLRAQGSAKGLQSIALRYFNAAGADPEGRSGERHTSETHLIPLVIQAALGQRDNITIFGDDYDTADGTCIRDYIHVTDLAHGHVAAVRALDSMGAQTHAAMNLGTGHGHSVRHVIDTVEKVTQRKITRVIAPRRPGDPPYLVADPSKAGDILHWSAERSDLETIIQDAWMFFSNQERS